MADFHYCRRRWPADPTHVAAAREQLRICLSRGQVRPALAADVVLATSEALDNATTHAYRGTESGTDRSGGPAPGNGSVVIELTVLINPDEVMIIVTDFGHWHDPATTELEHDTPTHRAGHGRGLTVMNAVVDEVAIHHSTHGSTVLLRALRKPPPTRRDRRRG